MECTAKFIGMMDKMFDCLKLHRGKAYTKLFQAAISWTK